MIEKTHAENIIEQMAAEMRRVDGAEGFISKAKEDDYRASARRHYWAHMKMLEILSELHFGKKDRGSKPNVTGFDTIEDNARPATRQASI